MPVLPKIFIQLATTASLATAVMTPAHAFFEDAEARKAILELRERFDSQNKELDSMRRSLVGLQTDLDTVRGELARQYGQNEILVQQVLEQKTRQQNLAAGLDARLRQFEPATVELDGKEFLATPAEAEAYELAIEKMRNGEFKAARLAFNNFQQRYPDSGYRLSVLFWLGNTQYIDQDYKEAIFNFKQVMADPTHGKAPEAALSMASSQVESKDRQGAMRTLRNLIEQFPDSDAAEQAKERLTRIN